MEMPSLAEAHHRLHRLAGVWTGEDRFPPSSFCPEGASASAKLTFRVALGGFAVIEDYEQRAPDGKEFSAHGLFRWDAEKACYFLHWFDSFGGSPSLFHGEFTGDRLVLTDQNQYGHWRLTYDLGPPGRCLLTMEMSDDGETWATVHEGRYSQQPLPVRAEMCHAHSQVGA